MVTDTRLRCQCYLARQILNWILLIWISPNITNEKADLIFFQLPTKKLTSQLSCIKYTFIIYFNKVLNHLVLILLNAIPSIQAYHISLAQIIVVFMIVKNIEVYQTFIGTELCVPTSSHILTW